MSTRDPMTVDLASLGVSELLDLQHELGAQRGAVLDRQRQVQDRLDGVAAERERRRRDEAEELGQIGHPPTQAVFGGRAR